jgi:hypothetical protein
LAFACKETSEPAERFRRPPSRRPSDFSPSVNPLDSKEHQGAHGRFSDEKTKESVMTHASNNRQLQRTPTAERRETPNFTIAVVMAGIFAFFIAGIASAFIYAKDTNPPEVAAVTAPAKKAPGETTGSGSVK